MDSFLYAKLNDSNNDLSISYINFRGPDDIQKKTRNQELQSFLEDILLWFTSMAMFLALFDYVEPAANCKTSYYYKASDMQTQ